MRQNVVVPKGWNNRNDEIIGWVGVIYVVGLAKDFDKFVHHKSVELDDLFIRSRKPFIVVMASRVTGPYNKVDLIFYILFDPLESRVHQCEGRVAVCHLGTIVTRLTFTVMAGLSGIGADFVEGIGVDVCGETNVSVARELELVSKYL